MRSVAILTISILAVALCTIHELAQATKWSTCDQDKSESDVSNVVVSQCETLETTCPFNRGFNKSIELDFTPKKKVEQVKVKIAGKLNHLLVPFHIKPDEACGNYGFDCPLEANKAYRFKMTLPVLRTYPKISVDVFLRLIDESGNVISCVEIPARIQEPPKDETSPSAATQ